MAWVFDRYASAGSPLYRLQDEARTARRGSGPTVCTLRKGRHYPRNVDAAQAYAAVRQYVLLQRGLISELKISGRNRPA
jgi:hypothetical protein